MATCRSCGAEIEWAVTSQGKKMPLDMDNVPGIVIVTGHDHNEPVVRVTQARRSHFVTCPQADQWRRQRAESD